MPKSWGVDTLKQLYLASFDMVGSEPDMPTHDATEREFEAAMPQAHKELANAGVNVPALEE